jgi:hydrogenase nickel incorporation protein HypA/HybF
MHEGAIASAIVEQAVEAAASHGGGKITAIEVEIGMLQLVVPEALETAFEYAAAETPAEGAVLHMTQIRPEAHCRQCGHRFEPDVEAFSFLCPVCTQADIDIVAGNAITLRSLTCDNVSA